VLLGHCYSLESAVINVYAPLAEVCCIQKSLPLTKALVRPVKLDPSVVLTTVTASVEGGAAPWATATVGFQPAIIPSIVENKNRLVFLVRARIC